MLYSYYTDSVTPRKRILYVNSDYLMSHEPFLLK